VLNADLTRTVISTVPVFATKTTWLMTVASTMASVTAGALHVLVQMSCSALAACLMQIKMSMDSVSASSTTMENTAKRMISMALVPQGAKRVLVRCLLIAQNA